MLPLMRFKISGVVGCCVRLAFVMETLGRLFVCEFVWLCTLSTGVPRRPRNDIAYSMEESRLTIVSWTV
jgi:hypothetical protein